MNKDYVSDINSFKGSLIIEDRDKIESYEFCNDEKHDNLLLTDTVIFPNSLKEIGKYAFKNQENLKFLNIPNSVEKIESGAFEGCSKLEKVILPSNITELLYNTFSQCTSLKSIEIPKNVTQISDQCFMNSSFLEEIVMYGNTFINVGFYKKEFYKQRWSSLYGIMPIISNMYIGLTNKEYLGSFKRLIIKIDNSEEIDKIIEVISSGMDEFMNSQHRYGYDVIMNNLNLIFEGVKPNLEQIQKLKSFLRGKYYISSFSCGDEVYYNLDSTSNNKKR